MRTLCKKIMMITGILVTLTGAAWADKWQIMTFTDNIEGDLETLSQYCLLHDVTSEDVLWANNTTVKDLVPGKQIYLPASQVDMLSIWQNQGAWKPKALVKTTSAAAAERARGITGYVPPRKEPATPTASSTPAPASQKPAVNVSVPAPVKTQTPTPPTPAVQPKAPAQTPSPALSPRPQPKKPVPAKPDDTIKKDDPIILLSPDGDSLSGPMRLVVSGDKVMVVRLPKSAAPRDPALALQSRFSPSLLPPLPPAGNGPLYPRVANGKMLWPVDGKVSSPFGRRGRRRHDGVDIPMPPGTPIRAARDGVVAATGTNSTPGFRGYGNFVLLDHGQGIKTLYAHCSKVNVAKGQRIRQGEIVALVGHTGRASTDHVHFEVRVRDQAVDPIPYL
ncbi:MAG: peptidoglycan DD-metalloendopeptidase family protein, partial [Synergistaceae bacterium]|nr:peptidoglycan DD-metalloendopeptidase family protein [Synergistaceae bacterium]